MIGIKGFARLGTWCATAAAAVLLVTACGTGRQTAAPGLSATDTVAVASIANYTETPGAGRSAGSIAAKALRANGLTGGGVPPADAGPNPMVRARPGGR